MARTSVCTMPVLKLLFLLSFLIHEVRATCKFPEFLQRDEPWAADYGEGTFVAYVKGKYMQINQLRRGSGSTYARRCIQKAADGKYLVTHEEEQKDHRFMCMQFLQRSENIVQLKVSRASSRRSIDLCLEHGMALDHWPIVQMSQTPDRRIPCPFVGGFDVQMYFPNNTMVCNDHMLMLRIESECEKGEGILFDFRDEQCIPPSLPREKRQRAFCIAHWSENGQTFVVLQHETVHKQIWCLRIKDALGDMKGMYLMLDFVCDPNESVEETLNYYYIRTIKHVFSSICADAVEGCSMIKDFCNTDYRQNCAKTCHACEYENEIGLCTFPEYMRGPWVDTKGSTKAEINVYDYSVDIGDIGRFQCLEMQSEMYKRRRVLLELFDNGCYPRYACVELERVALPVMKYRLGNRLDWPLKRSSDQKQLICEDENFRAKPRHKLDESLRLPRLLINKGSLNYAKCDLPTSLQYGVSFREEGKECGGCLYYDPLHRAHRITVQRVNCSTPTYPIDYRCLHYFQFGNNTHAVVTKSRDEFQCWVFTEDSKIKVLAAGDCLSYDTMDLEDLAQYLTITEDNLCQNVIQAMRPTTTTTEKSTQMTSTLGSITYTVVRIVDPKPQVNLEPRLQHGMITPKPAVSDHIPLVVFSNRCVFILCLLVKLLDILS